MYVWPLFESTHVIRKTGSTQRIAVLSERDRATTTGNKAIDTESLVKFGRGVLEIHDWTCRQTDRHKLTAMLIAAVK